MQTFEATCVSRTRMLNLAGGKSAISKNQRLLSPENFVLLGRNCRIKMIIINVVLRKVTCFSPLYVLYF